MNTFLVGKGNAIWQKVNSANHLLKSTGTSVSLSQTCCLQMLSFTPRSRVRRAVSVQTRNAKLRVPQSCFFKRDKPCSSQSLWSPLWHTESRRKSTSYCNPLQMIKWFRNMRTLIKIDQYVLTGIVIFLFLVLLLLFFALFTVYFPVKVESHNFLWCFWFLSDRQDRMIHIPWNIHHFPWKEIHRQYLASLNREREKRTTICYI